MSFATPAPADDTDLAFRREDRLGLAIALGLHAVLLIALVAWDKAAPPAPIPDRITVTVSDEIALESVSPNPMADPAPSVAQELGPVEPAADAAPPVPTPVTAAQVLRPQPRPALVPSPTKAQPTPAKAQPKPAPKARPRPEPKRATGSRLGDDFLSGTGGKGADADQPAARAGPLTAASLSSAISRQLRPHWTAPQGVDAEKLVTVLSWRMDRGGNLIGRPEVVSQSGVTPANEAQKQRHAELAIRAVQLAAPFDLPDDYYDMWKNVSSFRFDRRL